MGHGSAVVPAPTDAARRVELGVGACWFRFTDALGCNIFTGVLGPRAENKSFPKPEVEGIPFPETTNGFEGCGAWLAVGMG